MAHVLDQPECRDVQLLIHAHGAPRIGHGNGLRGRHEHAAGHRHTLAQAERDVARARRHVDDQVVDGRPADLPEELLDHAVQHRPAPNHRRIVVGQKRHRYELDAVLLRGNDLLAVGRQLCADAEHDRHVRAVDVAIDHRHPPAGLAERYREIDRHGRLADATLAGAHGDDVLHALDRRPPHLRRRRRSHLRGHLDLDRGHPRQRGHHGAGVIAHLILDRARRRRQLDGERHLAAADAHVLDELERDDVAVQVRIAHRAERLEDGLFSDWIVHRNQP